MRARISVKNLIGSLLLACSILLLLFFYSGNLFAQTNIGVSLQIGDTTLKIEGKTSPNSQVTFMENSVVIGTTVSDSSGNFTKTFVSQNPGIHDISVFSTDSNSTPTSTVNISVSLLEFEETLVNNLILPPTIYAAGPNFVPEGGQIEFYGYGVPGSAIRVFISGIDQYFTVTADIQGFWFLAVAYDQLPSGVNAAYAVAVDTANYSSLASQVISFSVAERPLPPAPPSTPDRTPIVDIIDEIIDNIDDPKVLLPTILRYFDIDGDQRIELSELHIALRRWVAETERSERGESRGGKCDLNNDNVCDIIDFSILMYYVER